MTADHHLRLRKRTPEQRRQSRLAFNDDAHILSHQITHHAGIATFLFVLLLLAVTAVLSVAGPAWRAVRIDPAVTLRHG
jgi:ABC-type lipoprotein release transport system permease subunit